tara:strand:+ start:8 stop:172 length:165 start_codon:yes stop_codon:yes gene_type:complete
MIFKVTYNFYNQVPNKAQWEFKEKTFDIRENAYTFAKNIYENVAVKNITIVQER